MNAFRRPTNHEVRMPTAVARCALIAVVALTSLGCGRPQTWQFTLKAENGKAKIETDRVAIIFEGVPFDPAPGGTGGEATGSLAFAGPGKADVSVTAGGKTFKNSYAGGVNTMTFAGHTLTLREAGTKLEVGPKAFDLGAKKKTIVIREDGSAEDKQTE